jgi:hypothetical protein
MRKAVWNVVGGVYWLCRELSSNPQILTQWQALAVLVLTADVLFLETLDRKAL